MHAHLRSLAATQRDLVAAWQLRQLGWTWDKVRYVSADWTAVHSGVYALTHAPLTVEQRRMAATLTAPDSFLAYASAGAHYGVYSYTGRFETIVRHGRGGRRHHAGLLVTHPRRSTATPPSTKACRSPLRNAP